MTSKSTAKNGCATNEALGMGRSFGKRAKNTAGNGWAAGEVAAGAGPFPVFRVGRELGVNGIPFDVAADALKFGTAQDGVFGVSSNLWVGQPKRPEGSRVQSCV